MSPFSGFERMRPSKEELWHGTESAVDLISAVKELHGRSSLELHKLLKENEDFCICYCSKNGLSVKIDVEKLAGLLPLHLLAVLLSSDRDEEMFRYSLSAIRLLHTLCDLAPRHTRLEQVLLDDVKLSEQMLDLVIYLLIVLGGNGQASRNSDGLSLMHTTLVASSLYLLHGFISSHWQELVQVLLAHPKVDIFIDSAFGAVHNVVRSLQMKLLSQRTDRLTKSGVYSERAVSYHCQQAEAAVQFLHSLCQQKPFRERLAKNKELCGNGGVLMLAQSILSLSVAPQLVGSTIMTASISRMKAKVLSILLHLFEAESVSFLDEVATAGNLQLAKSIATEVLELLRVGLSKASKDFNASSDHPMGFVLLNAMRLADVFTDDSNFRSFFTQHFSEVLSAIFSVSHGDFLSMWCSSDLPSREDEATLDYDQFASSGWVLDFFSSSDPSFATQFKLSLLSSSLPKVSYVHQRTSLFIKMIANLHCFVPNICEEQERNRFFHNFTGALQKDPSSILPGLSYTSTTQRGTSVCRNLCSLLSHAESLIPNFLNHEDLQLLRAFYDQLQPIMRSELEESQVQETQSTGGNSSAKPRKETLNLNNGTGNLNEETSENSAVKTEGATRQCFKEEKESTEQSKILGENDGDAHNLETSGSDTSSTRGKNCTDRVNDDELLKANKCSKESGPGRAKEDEKVETVHPGVEKPRRKRKRSIMNDEQMAMIERALLDEPDMQRNSASIQTWADKLSHHGSEVTSSQLKNWLNNRKAKLARASKQAGPARDSSGDLPDSPGDENISQKPSTLKNNSNQVASRNSKTGETSKSSGEGMKPGQRVVLIDEKGEEVGKGKVEKTEGKWHGVSLDSTGVYVVDVVELTGYDKKERLPYPSEAIGISFEEAESRFGVMRVAWDAGKLQNEEQ